MTSPIFKKAIFISLLGHIAAFSIFSFSFGTKLSEANYTKVSFLGAWLISRDLIPALNKGFQFMDHINLSPQILRLESNIRQSPLLSGYSLKPQVNPVFNRQKLGFIRQAMSASMMNKRKEPVIMFYPALPYNFLLYFQDRQAVHIELMFNIISNKETKPERKSIVVKRKISSGNLEADLLSLRYISHYLFIQQARFAPDSCQTVKIDLSAKNDYYRFLYRYSTIYFSLLKFNLNYLGIQQKTKG